MNQFSFQALGTVWWIEIFDDIDEQTLTIVNDHSERFVRAFENTYSRFKIDSDISILNEERVFKNPSLEFRSLLTYGKGLFVRSHTTFNILTGHVQEAQGYNATYSFSPKENSETPIVCNPLVDLSINDEEITITCGKVDLGGYGKGYLIDLVTIELKKLGINYFLINGGGDMYATSDKGEPIEIFLEHPTKPQEFIMPTHLINQGFAASSPFKRQWHHEGKTYTHVISNTEVPAIATFIKAKTACDADAFATCALLLPEAQLLEVQAFEKFECARFDPATNDLWQSVNFSNPSTT